MPDINIHLQVPKQIIRINHDSQKDLTLSERSASKDKYRDRNCHQPDFQITATLPFLELTEFQRVISLYDAFTDCVNEFRKISTVTNQTNRSNDHTFMLKTTTNTVPALFKTSFGSTKFC